MIRKSGNRFSLATNAKRLRGDHAQTIGESAMTIHPELIALWSDGLSRQTKTGHAQRGSSCANRFCRYSERFMTSVYLTTALAVIVTTSLASNLLWVMAFGTAASGFPGRLRSALGEPFRGLRRLVDGWVAAVMARCVRHASLFRLDDRNPRGRGDIECQRRRFRPIRREWDGHVGAGRPLSQLRARTAAEARPR
jgi:hypothetical protein